MCNVVCACGRRGTWDYKLAIINFRLMLYSLCRDKSFSQMTRGAEICNATAILEVSGKRNLLINLNRVPSIVLGRFHFQFPIDFIGGP